MDLSNYNILISNSIIGDPVTSFEYDKRGYIIIGTSLGLLYSTPILSSICKIIDPLYNIKTPSMVSIASSSKFNFDLKDKEINDSITSNIMNTLSSYLFDDPIKTSNIKIKSNILASSSEECIRDIFIKDDNINAVIGDQLVKIFDTLDSASIQIVKFRRPHLYSTCPNTITLHHEGQVVVLTYGTNDAYFINLETYESRFANLPVALAKNSVAVDFDGNRLVWVEQAETGQITKIIDLNDLESKDNIASYNFPRNDKHYWGFQLHNDLLAYVSNWRRLKVLKLSTNERLFKMEGHYGNILTFCWDYETENDLYTLGADRRIIWWHLGEIKRVWDVKGSVGLWYPHIIKKIGNSLIYSADDGIYFLNLTL